MKKIYVNVSGNVAKPLPKGHAGITHVVSIEDSVDDNDSGVSTYYVVNEDGSPRVKTPSELEADALALAKETLRVANKGTRDEALANLTVEVDGMSIQVRPKDELNIRLKLQSLEPLEVTKWTLSDNTRGTITREQLELAYATGLTLGAEIYDTYNDTLDEA